MRTSLDSLPAKNFTDAAVSNAQATGDLAGAHALLRQLHDALSYHLRQRSPVDEDPPKLVHPTVPWQEARQTP